jgi:hypothetical protein
MLGRIRKKLDLDKPVALGWGEWEDWHKQTKAARPMAYFIMETIPDKVDDVVRFFTKPINDLRYAIRVRLFDRYHVIRTGLKPGYQDADSRMLHGMFNLLVDFVEVELAWMHVVFDEDERRNRKHPWWSLGWTRFKAFRDPRAGLDHLRWEMTLGRESLPMHERNPGQAARAREIWEIYHWWKFIRPRRPDPNDISGWSDYCESKSMREMFGNDQTPEDLKISAEIIARSNEIEQAYDTEDEEMLIRLVKLRKSLWT